MCSCSLTCAADKNEKGLSRRGPGAVESGAVDANVRSSGERTPMSVEEGGGGIGEAAMDDLVADC